MNRQRLDLDSIGNSTASMPPSTPPAAAEVKLSAELWAHVLQFAYLDEVLAITEVGKFFFHDVPPQLKHLLVRSGESMDVAPAAIERFSSVEDVFVYSLIEEVKIPEHYNEDAIMHLDSITVENVVPFLKHLPELKFCYLGGLSECGDVHMWVGDIRMDQLAMNVGVFDTSDSKSKMAELVESVCLAYAHGDFSNELSFRGLLPLQCGCFWKGIPKLRTYRDDVSCQICDMICMTLPPLQVMRSDGRDIFDSGSKTPCISRENRLRIARLRDYESYQANLTKLLASELQNNGYHHVEVMCPPDSVHKGWAVSYDDMQCEEMNLLLFEGANINDASIRKSLIEREAESFDEEEDDEAQYINNKRIMELGTYNKLKEIIGFNINQNDFALIDRSHTKTSYSLYQFT